MKVKGTSAGLMTTSHVAAVQLELATGAKFAHMFYEQQGEQRGALLGGHADVEFNPASESAPAVSGGQLRALAVCDEQPSRFLPGVQTAISLGYNSSMASVRGIAVPAGTPDDAVNAIDAAVKKSLANPENQKKLEQIMLATLYMGPKEYAAYWAEFEKTVKAVLDATSK